MNINSIHVHPKRNKTDKKSNEYIILLEKIKAFGLLEPIIVEKKTNYVVSGHMRYWCCKGLGKRKIQVIKRNFKFDVIDLINFEIDKGKLLSERIKEYHKLNKEIKKLGYTKSRELMNGMKLREYLFKQTGIFQSQIFKLKYIEMNDIELHDKVLKEEISVSKAFKNLKNTVD